MEHDPKADMQVLNKMLVALFAANDFYEVFPSLVSDIRKLLDAERITVFQRNKKRNTLMSFYMDGINKENIYLKINTQSIAGYAAMMNRSLLIKDVYSDAELRAIDAALSFDDSFDKKFGFRTCSMIVVPIMSNDHIIGLLQVINSDESPALTENALKNAKKLAKIIGLKFKSDLHVTAHPYELLLREGKINEKDLKALMARQQAERRTPLELLLSHRGITLADVARSYEAHYLIPFHAYDPALELPEKLIGKLSKNYLSGQEWLPIRQEGNEVTILICDPADDAKRAEIAKVFPGHDIFMNIGTQYTIHKYIDRAFHVQSQIGPIDDNALANLSVHELIEVAHERKFAKSMDQVSGEEGQNKDIILLLVDRIIFEAFKQGVSDIHFEPEKSKGPLQVRFRVDSECKVYCRIHADIASAIINRVKIVSNLDVTENRLPQDGKATIELADGNRVSIRIAVVPTVNGENVVIRLLINKLIAIDSLPLTDQNRIFMRTAVSRHNGVVLVVGPTGSGKTSTLHSMIANINNPTVKILSAEDPVEITQDNLQQVQVNERINLTFPRVLRAFLRADPDIIVVGEIRDAETSSLAIQASLTGHLVLSTLHTNSAVETITRLKHLNVQAFQLADALRCVISQRLLRRLCGVCKEKIVINEDQYLALKEAYNHDELFNTLGFVVDETEIYKAVGCDDCMNKGYKSRLPVYEILECSEQIRKMIYRDANALEIQDMAIGEGMRTLAQDCILKIKSGDLDIHQLQSLV